MASYCINKYIAATLFNPFNMHSIFSRFFILSFCTTAVFVSCKNKKEQNAVAGTDIIPSVNIKKDTGKEPASTSPPIINITDTLIKKQLILYVKDSAKSSAGINRKLASIYKKILPQVARENKISLIGSPMAWYKSQGTPFFFEAGYMVSSKPVKKLPARVFTKTIGGDSAVVAHFYGPYDILNSGYQALKEWMKSNRKKSAGPPYEIYVSDPFATDADKKDLYKTRTDIFFPHH